MGKKDRVRPSKPCDTCGLEADTQFRVRYSEQDTWRIVCKGCQSKDQQWLHVWRYVEKKEA